MAITDRIEIDPRVCNGKAVVQGTRIPVSVILDQIASGDSWDDIIKGYPELKKEDIQAALAIEEGLKTKSATRKKVFSILEGGQ